MKCPTCGKEIANDSKFCEFCGAKIEQPVAQPTQQIETPIAVEKQRHGFITFWLWFMIVINIIVGITNFASGMGMITILAGGLSIVNVINAILLLNWKKVGFWLFIVTAICACVLNFSLEMYSGAFGAVAGVAILFGILQLKKNDVSCWSLMD